MNKLDIRVDVWLNQMTRQLKASARVRGTGRAIEVIIGEPGVDASDSFCRGFLDGLVLKHMGTFQWLLEHATPVPHHEMPPSITFEQLNATTQYLKGDQNV